MQKLPAGAKIKDAALAIGVGQGRLSDLFAGRNRAGLTVTQAKRLADYLDVPLDEVADQAGDAR